MPEPKPLFDEAFQSLRRARCAAKPCALFNEAQARLDERAADVRTPPPALVTSCLALQSVNDLPGTLRQIYEDLPEGGLFLGVLAGGETLRELRLCLTEAELALKGGASPRIAPMIDLLNLSRLLPAAGFALPVVDTERVTLLYPDLASLLHELRSHGWANSLTARSRSFAPRALFPRAEELYRTRFPGPTGRGLAVTVDLLFLHGWKETACSSSMV